jgi:TRAP-type C4-dicarboxylate transport system substrate-binding protein
MTRLLTALTLLAALAGPGRADQVLRMASIIPEGTSWARTLRAFAREVESGTGGKVKVKLYLGGIAGDEMESLSRLKRQQLDGAVSAGMLCDHLAPTFRVMRVPGVFQSRDENAYVLGRLKPDLDKEFLEQGFVHLGSAGVGAAIIFSRTPVTTMTELRAHPLWVWDIDEAMKAFLPMMGIQLNPTPISLAGRSYDEGKVDGFVAPSSAALGFQWSAQVKYFTELRLSYVSGCLFLSSRAFDALPHEQKQVLLTATAKIQKVFEEQGRQMDDELLGGLFQKQGLKKVAVNESFRAEFFDAARSAREKVVGKFVPERLMQRVLGLLADFRGSR